MTQTSYTSQWEQDKILNETIFECKRNGVFIDVGAHDGKTGSNTYFFEKELNWTGICIEPIQERFKELVINRPNSICVYGCAFDKPGVVQFREVAGYSEMLSGIEGCYDPRHTQRILNEIQQCGGGYNMIEKPAFCLKDLISQHNINTIDYLTIDTEGSELEVLKGIDFDKVDIHVIDVENNYGDNRIQLFLEKKGYLMLTKIVGDDIYVK
jgi:FkbM family methyltransferase